MGFEELDERAEDPLLDHLAIACIVEDLKVTLPVGVGGSFTDTDQRTVVGFSGVPLLFLLASATPAQLVDDRRSAAKHQRYRLLEALPQQGPELTFDWATLHLIDGLELLAQRRDGGAGGLDEQVGL